MADIERSIKLGIDTGNSVETLGKLRRELASLTTQYGEMDQGTDAFRKLESQIKDTESAIKRAEGAFGDATDKIKTLSGSGVERFNASFGLMKEGIKNLDLDKFKIGIQGATNAFGGLKNAIIATGIGALVIAITAIIANFDKLKMAGGLVGKVFTAIGDTISIIVDGIIEFTNAIGLTAIATNEATDATREYDKALKDINLSIDDAAIKEKLLNGEITEGVANRESAEAKKLKAISDAEAEAQEVRDKYKGIADKNLTEAQRKELNDTLDLADQKIKLAELNYTNEIKTIENGEKAKADAKIQADADAAKRIAEANARLKKQLEDKFSGENELERLNRQEKEQIAEAKRVGVSEEIILNIRKDFFQKRLDLVDDNGEKLKSKEVDLTKKTLEKVGLTIKETPLPPVQIMVITPTEQIQAFFETYKQEIDASLQIGTQLFSSLGGLNDLLTLNKIKNLEKGSKAEEAVLKKSFERGKKIAIAQATIAGIQGVINALTAATTIPEPFGTILKIANAASVAVSTAVNIAKIKAQKFESTSSPQPDTGGTNNQSGTNTGGDLIKPPIFNLGGQQIGGASNMLGSNNVINGQPIKVFVTETDISSVQGKVAVTEGNSLFGGGG